MRISSLLALLVLINLIVINKSQKVPTIPWPPQVSYVGAQTNWTQVAPTNFLTPREYQSVVHDYKNNRLIIFGGRAVDGTYLNDVWSWSLVARRFIQINPQGSIPVRSNHIAGVDTINQRMYVFGGKNKDGTLGDFYYLSLISGNERWVDVCGNSTNGGSCNNLPSARWGAVGGSWVGDNPGLNFFVSHGKSGKKKNYFQQKKKLFSQINNRKKKFASIFFL